MKFLKRLLIGAVALIATGILIEQVFQLYLDKDAPSDNAFVKINGLRIHYVKKGTGGPTVVFQSGLGSDYKIWQSVQDSVAKFSTTLSYDRDGLLWSESSGETKTLERITEELEQLLEKTNCPKPYILVGHSLAGITLRPFIEKHGVDIAGIVFVDVAHPQQLKRASPELRKYVATPPEWFVTAAVESGIFRILYHNKPFVTDLPSDHWYNRHVVDYFYRSYKTVLQEAREDDVMFEEAEQIETFGNIPLVIITGRYPNGVDFTSDSLLQQEYLALHRYNQFELLKLSSASRQVMAPNSGHYVPLQDADVISAEVFKLLQSGK